MDSRKRMGKDKDGVIFPVAPNLSEMSDSYLDFIEEVKKEIENQRLKVVLNANSSMICLYWNIGKAILQKQEEEGWGAKVIDRMAKDLKDAFPDMSGFSPRNIKYMRKFAECWPDFEIEQRVVAQIPWRSSISLMDKLADEESRIILDKLQCDEPQKFFDQVISLRLVDVSDINGAEKIAEYVLAINDENVDYSESLAAKEYFSYYHEGVNRRIEDPINSRLNYGYAIVRSAIARKLVSTGFHSTFGLHHDSQLNAFNLADDLIEPYRAMVDLVVHNNIGTNVRLTKLERKELAHVLHNACIIDGVKVSIMSAIDIMVESLKRIILDESKEKFKLPVIIPVESMEGITE